MTTSVRTRRRFIGITAAASTLAMMPGALRLARAGTPPPGAIEPLTWRGIALGADAELRLYHPDPHIARRLLAQSLAELQRLEGLFSLYREDSALATLNRQSFLDEPPADLLRLLSESLHYSRLTHGAFDPSVQPLWRLYADHFSRADANPAGPSPAALRDTLVRIGYAAIQADPQRIQLMRPGMALTLNGIAQGYITDRITELLRVGGLDRALVDLGEIRGLDARPNSGAPAWRVGLAQPQAPDQVYTTVDIRNQALATSGGYGTPLDPAGRHTHLFDPCTGIAQPRYRSVSVLAGTATMADALSTAFSNMALAETAPVVRQLGLRVWFVLPDGSVRQQAAQAPSENLEVRI
ncbi:FAD:protein FMN transferase [Bordetella sp. BOR01]|uniref:FAD:protein FMN transferase n=1 Tax=Bordetella sp. BOR01 TaxID=2854779 RepID=UPI001C46A901|nr:FAD:protein FMN transferase [Bordetella sp. BOR01]MBV7483246.1 FAD:protein FMN transferase [Bordetella sp. BOR01]